MRGRVGCADRRPDRASQMVAVAWAGRQSAWQDRCFGERDQALQRDLCPLPEIGQGVVGITYLHREQPALDPELRGEISQRRADRDRICRIDGERSSEQTILKKQQMQWSKEGAHLLLQTRVRTLNGELSAIFKRWYPDMDLEVEEMPVAA